jgi:hypothetical protein
MRTTAFYIVMLGAVLPVGSAAAETQPARPCGAAEYGQFDFWLGSWRVSNEGKLAGHNRIEKILDGCALSESWRSVKAHRGNSLTFYDAVRDLWHQTWIDVGGQPLYLEGRFANGRMRLEGTRPGDEGGPPVQHRVEWTALPDGRVRQHWLSSRDGGRSWTDVFDGYYERAADG